MPRFEPNPAAAAMLGQSPGLLAACLAEARSIATEAQRLGHAEAYDPSDEGSHYADMIHAEVTHTRHGLGAQVVAGKFTSNWIEFGFHHVGGEFISGKAIMRRAAEAKGRSVQGPAA